MNYPIEVKATTINELVKQGCYDWSDPAIKDGHFNIDVPHRAEIILLHFQDRMDGETALKALWRNNFRAASMPELLTLGIKYPKLQKDFPIVALGSIVRYIGGRRFVGCLYYEAGERKVYLRWFDCDWYNHVRFAAVRR